MESCLFIHGFTGVSTKSRRWRNFWSSMITMPERLHSRGMGAAEMICCNLTGMIGGKALKISCRICSSAVRACI